MVTQTTVSTDAQDYAPGAWAEIAATGFDPGSTVTFQVQHASDPGADGLWGTMDDVTVDLGGDGHDTWSVEDGSALDLDGTVNGSVVTSWYVNPDDSLNWHFLLTAMAANQQTASTSFTDATGSTNKVYQHWADGDAATQSAAEWNNNILNANKSDYFEGEVIPHVFVYKASSQVPLVNGQTYSFNVTYNYYQQNTNALGFDYLTTFNASRAPGQLGVTNPAITPTLDSAFTNNGGFTNFGLVSQGIYTVDADITKVSGVTTSGSGTLNHQVTITFTYTGVTTNNGVAEIYYGLHVAGPTATEKGASAWTGGSLQTTVDIGGSGATSIQLSPAAIIAGSISGFKFNDLNGNGIRDAGEPGIQGIKIYLDLNKDGVPSAGDVSQATDSNGFYSFSVTPDADKTTVANDPYIVREAVPSGWTQTSINPAPMIISAATPTYTNVNFGNQQQIASLSLTKTAVVEDGTADQAGDVIKYTVIVSNTGNVTLSGITLTDAFEGGAAASLTPSFSLAVGESKQIIYQHTVTQEELDTRGSGDGKLSNTATATAGDLTASDTKEVSLVYGPEMSLTKTAVVEDGTADQAGDVITYTVTVNNTGNVTLSGITLTDAFEGGAAASLTPSFSLGVGESKQIIYQHILTQEELDTRGSGDGKLTNTVTADSEETSPIMATAFVSVKSNPLLTIEKQVSLDGSTWFDADSATGPVANVSQTVYFRVVVTNIGNVTLSDVDVQDQVIAGTGNPLDFTFGSGVQTINLAPGKTATSNVVQVQALSGQQTDLATAFTTFAGTQVTATDYANYFGKAPTTALIAPTNTTVGQYLDGSALSFQKYYDFQGGVIQYTASLKTGKITQTNPGVFFYFTGATGSIKVADGNPTTTEQLSVTIHQTVTLKSGAPITSSLSAVQNNIQLYQVVDTNGNGKYDAGETVNTLSSKSYTLNTSNSDITLGFTGVKGSFYVVSVKYDTSSVIGASVGKIAATWPTVNYQFDTKFKESIIETYAGGVDLAPKKPAPMLLQGDLGDGAKGVNDAQIKHVVDAAICWWEDHGITAEQLAQLKAATVEITELGHDVQGWWLGASTGSLITIDDDAADHGWSLGLEGVAHNKVDLLSVLVHEMGHVLGKSDEDMGSTLAVGERMLPELSVTPPEGGDGDHDQDAGTDEDHGDDQMADHTDDHAEDQPDDHADDHSGDHGDHGVPTTEHMLTLVGSAAAEQQMHLHMS